MKILVKTDKGLKILGEGKIFSKNQLRLNENELNVTTNQSMTPQQSLRQSAKAINQDPRIGRTTTPTNYLDNRKDDDAPALTVSASKTGTPETMRAVNNYVRQNPDKGVITVVKDDSGNSNSNPYTGMQNSSVAPRKVMDEMRRNSIPFTKKELHKFLRDL